MDIISPPQNIIMTYSNYFYFFSTLAQTLAAVMAFLGVFVVFRLQTLAAMAKDSQKDIIQAIGKYFITSIIIENSFWRIANELLESHKNQDGHKSACRELRDLMNNHTQILRWRSNLLKDFFAPFIAISIGIAIPLYGIVFVQLDMTQPIIVIVLMLLSAISFPIIIAWVLIFMRGALRQENIMNSD